MVGRREGAFSRKRAFDHTRSGTGTRLRRKQGSGSATYRVELDPKTNKKEEKMIQIKIGIDNGNYNTKSSDRMLYASGFAVSDREHITSDMQLYYDGAYYAIGGKRMNFQQEKTKQNDTFILTLAGHRQQP